ncbi:helicase HerA domain-containing protein [Halobacteriales archaeon Cl-PHB]
MAETEHISVAETTRGPGASGRSGRSVRLPVVELLTGRGFVTGKSGSGKSNTASVVAEKLLDNGFGLLIVDIDGEYYGLKEEYEILHAGADEECDIQVTADHAEKLASLALEQNVPIILDVSSFLDEDEAEDVLTEVSRHLFAKAKKQKQPFLMLVEEVHEYIPENGSVGECGKMLIKIGKRGRKHGLGICGISQRPADVKKDFITQCDWMVWHRLTWDNDTKVVRRVLDGEYASAVEDLDDGEGFMMTDWSESVRRVQFFRKQTFDAGATPGLDDFERPDLKSVSDDLVSELTEISEEKQARETKIAELRDQLDEKNSRIAELEAELKEARDLSTMARQFVDAMTEHVQGSTPGRTEQERLRQDRERDRTDEVADDNAEAAMEFGFDFGQDGSGDTADDATAANGRSTGTADAPTSTDDDAVAAFGAMMDAAGDAGANSANGDATATNGQAPNGDSPLADASDDDDFETLVIEPIADIHRVSTAKNAASDGMSFDAQVREFEEGGASLLADAADAATGHHRTESGRPSAVEQLHEVLEAVDRTTIEMLRVYQMDGPTTAIDAYAAVEGVEDRKAAYARNRQLRTLGLVQHVGRGHYDYRLRDCLASVCDDIPEKTREAYAREVEEEYLAD